MNVNNWGGISNQGELEGGICMKSSYRGKSQTRSDILGFVSEEYKGNIGTLNSFFILSLFVNDVTILSYQYEWAHSRLSLY